MFRDFTTILKPGVVYYKNEADFASKTGGTVPARKNANEPTKTWGGLYADPIIYVNGNPQFGFLIFAHDGERYKSVQVETQLQKIDHLTTSVDIIPFYAGKFFDLNQHRFYVRYKNHPFFKDGFPYLERAEEVYNDPSFRSTLNFYEGPLNFIDLPPVFIPPTMAVRFKPGSDRKEIEVFTIEEFMKAYPPVEEGSTATVYKYDEVTLVQKVYEVMLNPTLDSKQKGTKIRELAEEKV